MGEGGFEPPKAKPADLQSVPFGHSGTLPNPTTTTIPQQNRFVKGIFCFFLSFFVTIGSKPKFLLTSGGKLAILGLLQRQFATVAQQVEQLTRNEQVARSNRVSSSKEKAHPFGWAFFFVCEEPLVCDSKLLGQCESIATGQVAPRKRLTLSGGSFPLLARSR